MNFIEVPVREYYRGGYITTDMYININDISRVVECCDDFSCTNIVTKDGTIYTITERYKNIVNKITNCSKGQKEEIDLIEDYYNS